MAFAIFGPTVALIVAAVVISRRSGQIVLWGRVAVVLAGEYLAGAWLGLWPLQPTAGPAGLIWAGIVHLLGG